MNADAESLFYNDHTIIILSDPETGAIMAANPAACTFYGYAPERFKTLYRADLEIAPAAEDTRHGRKGEDTFRCIGRHRLADGSFRDVEVHSGQIDIEGRGYLFSVVHESRDHSRTDSADNGELRRKVAELEASLSRYVNLYDNAPVGHVTLDGDGVIRDINLTGATLLRSDRHLLVGTPFSALIADEDRTLFSDHLQRCRPGDGPTTADLKLQTSRHSALYVQLCSIAVRKVSDGTTCLHTMITDFDITERRLAEHRIHRLNRLYTALSETNKAIVHSIDMEHLFRELCRIAIDHGGFLLAWIGLADESGFVRPVASFGEKIGYLDAVNVAGMSEPRGGGPTETVVREGSYQVCNDFLHDPATAPWHAAAALYGLKSSAAFALRQNGQSIGSFTLYAGESGYFDAQLLQLLRQMATDISFALDNFDREVRRQDAEQALRQETMRRLRALEELSEKDHLLLHQSRLAAMGEMIGNIAHQWRQPLNTLGLTVQDLSLSYELGEFSKELLDARVDKAMSVINQMSRTIDDFRNFVRPDKQKVAFKVSQIIDNTLSLIRGSLGNHGIKVEIDTGTDPTITGYLNQFSQVLLNILNNARDALIERAPGDPVIRIALHEEDGRMSMTIRDNAGGISDEILDKIFDPYFTTKDSERGTGLGLFMAKTIIESNWGGRLSVANRGDGAEFRIEV